MDIKPIIWVGSSKRDLTSLPEIVKDEIGFALYEAQQGGKNAKAKPFKGFKSASVLEVVKRSVGETYRAVYTVEFEQAIAVLHVFHKKSKEGIKTPRKDVELIKMRFKLAEKEYNEWLLIIGENHEQES
jgi:phage-related protein